MTKTSLPPEWRDDLAHDLWRGSPKDYPFRVELGSNVPPEFYEALGLLSSEWSDVEFFCRDLLGTAAVLSHEKTMLLTSGMQARTLIDTTRRVIHHVLPQYAKIYDVTHVRLVSAHEYRNQFVHATHLGPTYAVGPSKSVEWKVRLNKKGITFHREISAIAHRVRRRALMSRLLALKLMEHGTEVRRQLKALAALRPQDA